MWRCITHVMEFTDHVAPTDQAITLLSGTIMAAVFPMSVIFSSAASIPKREKKYPFG
jgi:hypothetical protein